VKKKRKKTRDRKKGRFTFEGEEMSLMMKNKALSNNNNLVGRGVVCME